MLAKKNMRYSLCCSAYTRVKMFRRKKRKHVITPRVASHFGEQSRYAISEIRHTEHGPNYIAKEWHLTLENKVSMRLVKSDIPSMVQTTIAKRVATAKSVTSTNRNRKEGWILAGQTVILNNTPATPTTILSVRPHASPSPHVHRLPSPCPRPTHQPAASLSTHIHGTSTGSGSRRPSSSPPSSS